jgi:hypothetical protein
MGEFCLAGACQGGAPLDLDGDGRVDAACGGTDCSDINPLVWSAPSEVANLSVEMAGTTQITWDSQSALAGPGTVYDLISGAFPGDSGFSLLQGACAQSGGETTYTPASPDPVTGTGTWYLVRARNTCGVGTYGSSERDALPSNCP